MAGNGAGQGGHQPLAGGLQAAIFGGDMALQRGGAQAACGLQKPQALALHCAGQGAGQAVCCAVQPLARAVQQADGAGQGAGQIAQALPALGQLLALCPAQPRGLAIQPCQQFQPHRHRQFGRRSGGGGAFVGGVIDQCGVCLMPHSRDQRNIRGGRGARHDFLVKAP